MRWDFAFIAFVVMQIVAHAVAGKPPEQLNLLGMVLWAGTITVASWAIYTAFKGASRLWRKATSTAVSVTRVAPYSAGRAVSVVERTAKDAAAAFRAGRDS